MRIALLVLAVLFGTLETVFGASLSIEQLEQTCNSKDGQTACAAYLMGTVHGLQLGTTWTKRGEPFCIPESITAPQAIDLFVKSVPKAYDLKSSAGPFFAAALANKYPCR